MVLCSVAPSRARTFTKGGIGDLGGDLKQPPHLGAILEELRRLGEEVAPDADASLKWSMPWFTVAGKTMCSLDEPPRASVNQCLRVAAKLARERRRPAMKRKGHSILLARLRLRPSSHMA
jgi:hypothetical protein